MRETPKPPRPSCRAAGLAAVPPGSARRARPHPLPPPRARSTCEPIRSREPHMRLASAARVLLAVLLAGGILHQPAKAENTILRLSETATVMATPDSLAASLRVEAPAQTAQEAQRRVNEAMREAIAAAKKADGISVSTSAYAVWRTSPNPADRNERWQA